MSEINTTFVGICLSNGHLLVCWSYFLTPAGTFVGLDRLPDVGNSFLLPTKVKHSRLVRSGRVVLYCDCPQNVIIDDAYFLLKDYGYRDTAILPDGFQGWVRRKYPVEAGRR
jgi:rhodanese-related sulfurtransferase